MPESELHGPIQKPDAQRRRNLALLGKGDDEQVHEHLHQGVERIAHGVADEPGPQARHSPQHERHHRERNGPTEQP